MNATDSYPSMTGNREMAAGVFKQAKQDLRRFHRARIPRERELYSDAYSWVMSEDAEWPFSFRNVCRLLNLSPEEAQQELLGDLAFGPLGRWTRRCGRTAGRLQTSFNQVFANGRDASARYAW
jgi:hypothetical protein